MVDLTITISVIIALCAIISPILVAIINNLYNMRMKKIEITKEFRLKAIENYVIALEVLCKAPHLENSEENYEKALGSAMIHVSSKTLDKMLEIDTRISRYNEGENDADLASDVKKLCLLLHQEIKI